MEEPKPEATIDLGVEENPRVEIVDIPTAEPFQSNEATIHAETSILSGQNEATEQPAAHINQEETKEAAIQEYAEEIQADLSQEVVPATETRQYAVEEEEFKVHQEEEPQLEPQPEVQEDPKYNE